MKVKLPATLGSLLVQWVAGEEGGSNRIERRLVLPPLHEKGEHDKISFFSVFLFIGHGFGSVQQRSDQRMARLSRWVFDPLLWTIRLQDAVGPGGEVGWMHDLHCRLFLVCATQHADRK